METHLHTLAYFSRHAIDNCNSDVSVEIADILEVARRKNRAMGVTGALIYSNNYWAQVLEGPLDAVENVFESILRDRRHRDVTVLHFKPQATRSFADWSMAFAGISNGPATGLDIDGILANSTFLKSTDVGQTLIAMLLDLIAKQERDCGQN